MCHIVSTISCYIHALHSPPPTMRPSCSYYCHNRSLFCSLCFISTWSFRSNSSMIFPLLCSLSSFAIYNPNSFWLSACLTVISSIYSCCYFLQLFPVTFHFSSCLYWSQIVYFSFFLFFYFLILLCSLYFYILSNYRFAKSYNDNKDSRVVLGPFTSFLHGHLLHNHSII